VPKFYTPAEKAALVGEVQRRQRAESLGIAYLARQLGFSCASYYNWLHAGVRAPATTPFAPVLTPSPAGKTLSNAVRAKASRRYDARQRAALLAEVTSRRQAGESLGAILKALDLGRTSYSRWRESERQAPSFRAVAVQEPSAVVTPELSALALVPALELTTQAPTAALTLVAPGGYRIEGLAVESAAALLRALA